MRVKRETEHVLMSFLDNHLYCFHCGDVFKLGLTLPAPVDMVGRVAKSFLTLHRRCKPSQRGADVRSAHSARSASRTIIEQASRSGVG